MISNIPSNFLVFSTYISLTSTIFYGRWKVKPCKFVITIAEYKYTCSFLSIIFVIYEIISENVKVFAKILSS